MAYIYKDFAQGRLQDDVRSRVYANDNMSADLKAGAGVTVVSLFGKTSRYDGVDPRCPLVELMTIIPPIAGCRGIWSISAARKSRITFAK